MTGSTIRRALAVVVVPALSIAESAGAQGLGEQGALASSRQAMAILHHVRERIGSAETIDRAGGLLLRATGTIDQGAEHQGRTPQSSDRVPFLETLGVHPASGRVGHEYRQERYDGTYEWVREVFRNHGEQLILVLEARRPFPILLRTPDAAAGQRQLHRRFPQLLLAEILENPAALRHGGRRGDADVIIGRLHTGETVSVIVDAAHRLTGVEYLTDVQTFGDTEVAWTFGDYRAVPGIGELPYQYGVWVDGRPFTDMVVRSVEFGSGASDFLDLPAGMDEPNPQVIGPEGDPSANARVDTVAPGVYVVRNLRGGFHPMFVEFEDFLIAADAPAGYRLLNQLPAGDVAEGPSSAWLSARYIELMKRAVPGKPIRYVVVTHFHNDHAGGLRAFVAEGATMLASQTAAPAIQRFIARPHTIAPDTLTASPRSARLEVVTGVRRIEAAGRRLDVIDVGPNPHTEQMLVMHLPAERTMFVSDLLTPTGRVDAFPTPSHEVLDRAFVQWLDERQLDPDLVLTMHGSGRATREHLDRLRE